MLVLAMPTQKAPATPFGARLIALRKAAGLTQVQLADALGITQPSLSYHESEGGPPSGELLLKMATALRVSVADLLTTSAAEPNHTDTESPPLATQDARRSWRRFQQLMAMPEKDRRAVFRMIDSLAKAKPEAPAAKAG
jgi:transcriptional regulator with XRE-family HTH domain